MAKYERTAFELADAEPAAITIFLTHMLKQLGGKLVLTEKEVKQYDNSDTLKLVSVTFDDEAKTVTLELSE